MSFLMFSLKAEESNVEETKSEVSEPEVLESKWVSNVELGYVATSGNTDTTSINSGINITYEEDEWRHSLDIKSIFGSAENDTTSEVETNAEYYFVQGKTDLKYSESSYAFLLANYEDDRFSENDYQMSSSFGRGFSLAPSEESKIDFEIGIGYRQTLKKATLLLEEENIKETIFRLALHYVLEISKNSKFEQKLSTDIGDNNTVTKSYSGLSANVAEDLALKLSITATHQSDVRAETEALDTITAFTLVYNF